MCEITKGSVDYDSALELLAEMNRIIDEADSLSDTIAKGLNAGYSKWRDDIEKLEDLKWQIMKALLFLKLYDEMLELDDLVKTAEIFANIKKQYPPGPDDDKSERKKLKELVEKIKEKKESIEKRLPKVPEGKMDWMYMINRYLKPIIERMITDEKYSWEELEKLLKPIHRYKKYALYWLPTSLCGDQLDWWYEKFRELNNLISDCLIWISVMYGGVESSEIQNFREYILSTLKSKKEEIENKIKEFKKYIN